MNINLAEISNEVVNTEGTFNQKQQSQKKGFLTKEIKLFKPKFSDKKKENFYSELSILLSSGIDIKTSLEIYLQQQKKEKDQKLFETINEKVVAGDSLSKTIQDTGKFSPYEYYSLSIGEESGRLVEVLNETAHFFSQKIKQKRQLTGAMTYPLVVLSTAVIAVYFMLAFIVPLFEDVFVRFDGDLPTITKKIIIVSEFIKRNVLIIVFFGLTIAGVIAIVKRKNWYRSFSSSILIRLPQVGAIIKKVYLARFCGTMSLLMSSKTPMLKSIDLVSKMIHFYPFEQALKEIQDKILHGENLNEAMKEYKIFDSRIISLTKVAEEVNQLDLVFGRLAKQYSEELEHQIGMLSNLLEPVMIIVVGIIVAIVLISMYLPLFQLSTSIL